MSEELKPETQTPNTEPSTVPSTSADVIKDVDKPTQSITDELLTKMVNLCEKQSETIVSLNQRLNDLESKHEQLNTEYQNDKPLDVRGEFLGNIDYSTKKQVLYSESYNDQKAQARNIMDRLQSLYPSA